jgi:two-component system, OmpR family, response regulator VicR
MSSILVVSIEDEPDMIDLIRLILRRRGYDVIGADGGRVGLEKVREMQPQLVLLDLMMPDLDGWEVYQQLKADPTTGHIPVIIVTAKAYGKERLSAVRSNEMDDYLIKPFGPAQLVESVERALARREA